MISTLAFMFARGLETRWDDLFYFKARPWTLLKSLLTVDVLVPLIAIAAIFLAAPTKATAVALLLLAASPVAPMALSTILKAGGDREYALGLHLVLAWLMIATTPLTLELLSAAAGFHLEVSPRAVAEVILGAVILPIAAGLVTRWLFSAASRRLIRPLGLFSEIVSMLAAAVLLLSTYQLLLGLDIRSYLAIALMILGSLIAGHLIARGRPGEQATLALESATGNIGLTMLIASSFTTLEKALPVIVPYIFTTALICLIYVKFRKRAATTSSSPAAD